MATQNTTITRDEKTWEVVVKAEISPESIPAYRESVLKELQKGAKMDGFRPGKVPTQNIVDTYGEEMIMRRVAEYAIQYELPELLAKEAVLIIESPKVITDPLESGKPISFTARAPMAPVLELGDYKKIQAENPAILNDTTVSDAEYNEALTHIRREKARIDKLESGEDQEKIMEDVKALKEDELPELDDLFTQSIGYATKSDFEKALRANIGNEKNMKVQEDRRGKILETLVKASKIQYPLSLREYELDDMEARITDDIKRTGSTFEKYLIELGKSREEVRETWSPAADARTKTRLVLSEIARKENLNPEPSVVDHEIEHAREHYPQASEEALRTSILHALRNEMTIRFLEGNTEAVGHTAEAHA